MNDQKAPINWNKNQPPTWIWAAVIGLALLLICGVSSLVYSINQIYSDWDESNNELATQVAADKRQMQNDLATQAAATATAEVAAQYEIKAQVEAWPVQLFDPFDENVNEWLTGEIDDEYTILTMSINGEYSWEGRSKQGFIWRVWPESESASDFYLAVDVQNLSINEDSYCGLIFRNNDGRYYFFEIWGSQNYRVLFFDSQEWSVLIPFTFTSAIRSGGINHLEVVSLDDEFYFYINEQFLAQLTGDTPSQGQVGVAAGLSYEDENLIVKFDNFEFRAPGDAE